LDYKLEEWVDNTLQWTVKGQLISLQVQDLASDNRSLRKNFIKDLNNFIKYNTNHKKYNLIINLKLFSLQIAEKNILIIEEMLIGN
jgi:hypothetical protein